MCLILSCNESIRKALWGLLSSERDMIDGIAFAFGAILVFLGDKRALCAKSSTAEWGFSCHDPLPKNHLRKRGRQM